MRSLPNDYLERAYAAVLGKLIGVYLGRPFENWTYERIMRELGPIEYYVHDRLDCPLIVTDDDIAGTFTFIRALEDHGARAELTAAEIGETWLNYIVEHRSILWWGGNGNSTEHTAWLNLKRGISAPASGSIATNGQAVAEQIGAQIFIDGWAIVAPGNPALAARLAEQAARVSHDGAAVDAAKFWAAMEAEAFVSRNIAHLIETGLAFIPRDGVIARLIADVRRWRGDYADWRDTRQRIADHYGYDKYPGNCHVVPNHAVMAMAALYAPGDFALAQTIVCTSGWDTDCNAGNVGCLIGAMLGLDGIGAMRDWRGPVADRMLISSADGGGAITDAVRTTYRLVDLGRRLAGQEPMAPPKAGAQFHFSLPGSVQGFRATQSGGAGGALSIENAPFEQGRALAISYRAIGALPASATTPTFAPPEVQKMRTYELMATPLVYPGQTVRARVAADAGNSSPIDVALRLRVYGLGDELHDIDGEAVRLSPGGEAVLHWRIPDLDGQPIQEIGLALASHSGPSDGRIMLDYLSWDGAPDLHLRRPADASDFWRRAWVNNVSFFSKNFPQAFRVSQDRGEGMIVHGTRQWTDYRLVADLTVHLARYAGFAVRVQGLRRYYGVLLVRQDVLRIVRVYDGATTILAETRFNWAFETLYQVEVEVGGRRISCRIGGVELDAEDTGAQILNDGGIALVICEGASSSNDIRVSPVGIRASIGAATE
jgi:ADP-ribosylglycohydrolase